MFTLIRTHAKLIILGLLLCATVGAVTPGFAAPISAAPTSPTIVVTAHDNWSGINMVPPNLRYEFTSRPHYTVRVTGSNFVAGSMVRIALMNTSGWQLLAQGSTYAQGATTSVLCGHDFKICPQPNPRAGTIDYRMRFSSLLTAADLVVLYRSSGGAGLHGVALQ